MEGITRKLVYVRRAGRWLLVGQRLSQVVLLLAAAALVLAPADYLLRLPGAIRLGLGVALVAAVAVWLVTRLVRAVRFRPGLSELALRVERLFPELAGRFASAVEFADKPERYADPRRTGLLAESSVQQMQSQVERLPMGKLLKPGRTIGWGSAALVAVLTLAIAGFAAPKHASIAAQRWLSPMNSPAWPKRTNVQDRVDRPVWALDSPVRMQARVDRGYDPDMRVTLKYRFTRPGQDPGPWQQTLMTAQREARAGDSGGRFERLIEPPAQLRAAASEASRQRVRLDYVIEAGDDSTDRQSLTLVPRPAVTAATARLTPPTYAKGLIDARTAAFHEQTGRVASTAALASTDVRLTITLNKPIPEPQAAANLMPGLSALPARLVKAELTSGSGETGPAASEAAEGASGRNQSTAARPNVGEMGDEAGESPSTGDTKAPRKAADRFVIAFPLTKSVTSELALSDRHGIEANNDRRYRFEAKADKPPSVTLDKPAADREVLPEAVVPLAAQARDDVGMRWLRIAGELPEPASESEQTTATRRLSEAVGRRTTMETAGQIDLANHALEPGDQVTLLAKGRDVYELNGRQHDIVRSSERTLTIIDKPTLLGQIREAMGALRQQGIELRQRQGQLSQVQPRDAEPGQRSVSRKLENQKQQLEALEQRLKRNRVEEGDLKNQLDEARKLVQQARAASDQAGENLEEAARAEQQDKKQQAEQQEKEGRKQQAEVKQKLSELVSLLDQGQDAMALKLKLDKLTRTQQQLAGEARKLLPRTAGRSKADLPNELKNQLEELSKTQKELSEEAQKMVRQMQQTARSLNESKKIEDKAAAKTLSEAARIAQRQGLNQQMKKAAEQAKQNKLSRASGQQSRAARTMQQMQGAMDQQQQEKREMLRRRLRKLAQLIQQLIDAQQRQHQALTNQAKDQVAALAPSVNQLRRRTMAAEQHARRNDKTKPAARPIGEAVAAQGQAIKALRAGDKAPAGQAEQQAVKHLKTALQRIREAQQKARENERQKQREKLRQRYLKLAEKQRTLKDKTDPLAQVEALNRKQQATVRDIGTKQGELQKQVTSVGEKVEKTLVFERMHQQVDRALDRVTETLNEGSANEPTVADQRFVARMLESMAEALKQPERDQDFARKPRQGGGGRGGGGGQQQSPVPPYAELKLLKAGQQAVFERTQELAEASEQGSKPAKAQLRELSGRQQDLAELGKTLIQRMQRQQGRGQPKRKAQ